jgi:hypothetical protein
MTTFRKITEWALQADEELAPGATVTVNLKSGATKQVVVGDFIRAGYGKYLYHVADND